MSAALSQMAPYYPSPVTILWFALPIWTHITSALWAYGARILEPPTDFPYGERQCRVEDPGGHVWTLLGIDR